VIALGQDDIVRYADASAHEGQRLRQGVLQGPHDRAFFRDTARRSSVIGVHFRPGGAAALLRLPLHELANRAISLDECVDFEIGELRERLQAQHCARTRLQMLERWLCRRLRQADERWLPDPAIGNALRQFEAAPALARVDAVRASVGLSERCFTTRFIAQVGLTPKRYLRVRRLQALLRAWAGGRTEPWVQLALDAGYSDQPHLSHEFRRLTGLAPTGYRPVSDDALNHVPVHAAENLQDATRIKS
jgi:AraC-like DNA-binding protein